MSDWWFQALLFAQEGGEQPAAPAARSNPLMDLLPMVAVMIALFYFMIIRPQRREQSRRDDMLNALKKNDRVVTIGGIVGSVANISTDGKEVTVKVDDNTRIRFLRSSIQQVLREEEKDSAEKAT